MRMSFPRTASGICDRRESGVFRLFYRPPAPRLRGDRLRGIDGLGALVFPPKLLHWGFGAKVSAEAAKATERDIRVLKDRFLFFAS